MILKGTPATISITYLDGDVPADAGTVTVGVTRADGAVVVAAGTATGGTGVQPRTFALTATHTAQVDVLEATWVSSTLGTGVTWHPIVGGFYVDLATLRGAGDLPESRFPDADLADARRWWADLVDDYCGQSFVPMHRLEQRWWRGGRLRLDRYPVREILSVSLAGVAVDTADWVLTPFGKIYTASGAHPTITAPGMLRISYEHGHDRPDAELYEVGVKAMRAKLLDDRTGGPLPRQLSVTNEFGTTRFSQAGAGRATPWPDVNAVLNRRTAAPLVA